MKIWQKSKDWLKSILTKPIVSVKLPEPKAEPELIKLDEKQQLVYDWFMAEPDENFTYDNSTSNYSFTALDHNNCFIHYFRFKNHYSNYDNFSFHIRNNTLVSIHIELKGNYPELLEKFKRIVDNRKKIQEYNELKTIQKILRIK